MGRSLPHRELQTRSGHQETARHLSESDRKLSVAGRSRRGWVMTASYAGSYSTADFRAAGHDDPARAAVAWRRRTRDSVRKCWDGNRRCSAACCCRCRAVNQCSACGRCPWSRFRGRRSPGRGSRRSSTGLDRAAASRPCRHGGRRCHRDPSSRCWAGWRPPAVAGFPWTAARRCDRDSAGGRRCSRHQAGSRHRDDSHPRVGSRPDC